MKAIKRIILFRFHDHFDVCLNHIEILKKFNPGIKMYGLYGGSEKDSLKAKKLPLEHVWSIPLDDPHWKWVNGDLCVRWWFKDFGKKLSFDMLHVIGWDLILLKPLEKQFAHMKDGVAITGVLPMAKIYNTWDWVAPKRGREEWLRLKKYVTRQFGYRNTPLAGVFGGASMSRKFLERYVREEIPSWCNDEVRLPLFAQSFKMPVHDTKLRSKFFIASGHKIFSPAAVYKNFQKGVSVFHPIKESLKLSIILKIKNSPTFI